MHNDTALPLSVSITMTTLLKSWKLGAGNQTKVITPFIFRALEAVFGGSHPIHFGTLSQQTNRNDHSLEFANSVRMLAHENITEYSSTYCEDFLPNSVLHCGQSK